MGTTIMDGLVLIGCGIVIGAVGLLLLREYRRLFFEDPKAVMSVEVLLQILKTTGPGYLAATVLFAAAFFVLGGIATLIFAAIRPFL